MKNNLLIILFCFLELQGCQTTQKILEDEVLPAIQQSSKRIDDSKESITKTIVNLENQLNFLSNTTKQGFNKTLRKIDDFKDEKKTINTTLNQTKNLFVSIQNNIYEGEVNSEIDNYNKFLKNLLDIARNLLLFRNDLKKNSEVFSNFNKILDNFLESINNVLKLKEQTVLKNINTIAKKRFQTFSKSNISIPILDKEWKDFENYSIQKIKGNTESTKFTFNLYFKGIQNTGSGDQFNVGIENN